METPYSTLYIGEIYDHYEHIKRLGQGSFGKVLLVQEKVTGKPMAMKLVRKDRTKLPTFLKELCVSISLSNNHGIITTYPVFINTMDYYVMTQELAGAGTLHHLIKPQVGMPEKKVKRCAIQLARALDFMHGRGLVHRDLKPDNVLLMDKECHRVKLCDFGLTQTIGSVVTSLSHIIPYLSPELCSLMYEEYLVVTPSVDSWAFAVLLFVCLTGNFPWKEALQRDIMYQVYYYWQKSANLFPPPAYWEKFTKEALNMFNKFFSCDPSSRPSVLSIMSCIHYLWRTEEVSEEVSESEEEDTEDEEDESTEEDTEDEEDESTEEEDEVIEVTEDNKPIDLRMIQDKEHNNTVYPELDPCNPVMDTCNPVMLVMSETETLALGSEVEIP